MHGEPSIHWSESLAIAWHSLTEHKLRSGLTMLGVVIGVAAVVALLSLGYGAQAEIAEQLSANGSNQLTLFAGSLANGGFRSSDRVGQLTVEDAEALADSTQVPSLSAVAPEQSNVADLAVGKMTTSGQVFGVTTSYLEVHHQRIQAGQFLQEQHQRTGARVAVLGANLARTLFGHRDPIGQSLRVSGTKLRVIGVLQPKGGAGFGSVDDGLLVPLRTYQQVLFGANTTQRGETVVDLIVVQARSQALIEQARSEVAALLRRRHQTVVDDFTIQSQQDLIKSVVASQQAMTLYLGAIAAISLVVSGIGIMNMQLAAIHERTREIGLRKAVGARYRDIRNQFLFEALLLSGIGSLLGLLFGIGSAYLAHAFGGGRVLVTIDAVLLAMVVALVIGVVFGLAPAHRAARMHPITALRME